MYSKPTLLKVGEFSKLTMHSRPRRKDKGHRRRPKGIFL
ncbi:lasso RiPP family leader peptide-containing protein [Streptomyces libani]|nr:lasso RiPP family leader peptide-containing protein [Streptomyces sp. SID4951]MYX10280.1 lasso RiPP family leader peptide-containing protein [Streptomyces sp. SID8375]SCK56452.1 hypothetical protein YWIDRAFT_03319 [Streptomyces sp. SceaMP-e96]